MSFKAQTDPSMDKLSIGFLHAASQVILNIKKVVSVS